MGVLAHKDFAAFFHAIWGFDPFPWQQDLLQRLATGKDPRRAYDADRGLWPDVLDLPTGSGKTATLDIAVFHLALEALEKDKRCAPARIAFIVDRRLIVDDAYARAKRIAQALNWSLLTEEAAKSAESQEPNLVQVIRRVRSAPVVRRTALQLCELAGPDQPPLIARSLRGGAPREDDWARTPVQPTILCSTVDQVGSRLLFRGYGVSDRMKPVHAGLLGSDCLILLDEAHLSEPFRQTLRAVERLRAPDTAPFGFAVLTATPSVAPERPFGLGAEDHSDPILSARIASSKPARLVEIAGKQDAGADSRRTEAVVAEVKAALAALQTRITNPAVGVVVNRVARARAVFEHLRGELEGKADVTLIIGPARSVDRDNRAAELAPIRTRGRDAPRALLKPLVVVATQTIEVGVDIDFDGLATEAAPLDALRQRFGRLNRAGRDITSEGVILAYKDDVGPKADDPVYGDRIRATWEKLQQLAAEADGLVDFGVGASRSQIDKDEAGGLAAPTVDAPILLPAYADLWSQTSPIPNADPDVALFLHGADRAAATVQIVWRADIERRDLEPERRARLIDLFTLVPPRAAEAIEVPLWAARAWLRQTSANQANFSDAVDREPDTDGARELGRRAFRWAGEDSGDSGPIHAGALRNGNLIVVPADYGGCDQWGWNPKSSESATDVAERAAWPYRGRRFAVRVTPELIAQGIGNDSTVSVRRQVVEVIDVLTEHAEDRSRQILDMVLDLDLPNQLKADLRVLRHPRQGRLECLFPYGFDANERPRGVIFVASRGVQDAQPGLESSGGPECPGEEDLAAIPATESDDLAVHSDGLLTLKDHCRDVRAWAERFASGVGLQANRLADVTLAAYLHDPGKADSRFQAFLVGGDPYGPDSATPLAKSGQARLPPGAWERAGLPSNWRHEALSVRLAMIYPDFAQAHDPELVLWLIGTHHGYGRPLFPHTDDKDSVSRSGLLKSHDSDVDLAPGHGPQSLAFDFGGLDWAQTFAHLKRRYGIWGLARLEALVRLADHRASEKGAPPEAAQPYKEAAE